MLTGLRNRNLKVKELWALMESQPDALAHALKNGFKKANATKATLKAALLSRPIFIMSVEWMCSSYCSPVELAMASLSVAGESLPTFHRFLDPGTIPEALVSDAYFSERRVHGVTNTQWRYNLYISCMCI